MIPAEVLTAEYGPPLVIEKDVCPGDDTMRVNSARYVNPFAWSVDVAPATPRWIISPLYRAASKHAVLATVQSVRLGDLGHLGWPLQVGLRREYHRDFGDLISFPVFGNEAGPLVLHVHNPHPAVMTVRLRLWRVEMLLSGEVEDFAETARALAQLRRILQAN